MENKIKLIAESVLNSQNRVKLRTADDFDFYGVYVIHNLYIFEAVISLAILTMILFTYFDFIVFRHKDIIVGIKHSNKIEKVAQSQAQALPYLLETNSNLCIAMSTGSGKTLLYAIAAISKVDTRKNHPQVLCVCHTYEAALQTAHILHRAAMFTHVEVGLVSQDIGLAAQSKNFYRFQST